MYQKDFILRLIEDFFRFLNAILKLQTEKRYDEALKLADEAALSLLNIKISDIEKLPNDQLALWILQQDWKEQQYESLAGLMCAKADIYEKIRSIFSAIDYYDKALQLYQYVEKRSSTYSLERNKQIENIKFTLIELKHL